MNHSVLYMQQQAEQRVKQMREQARRYVEEPPERPSPASRPCGGHAGAPDSAEDSDRWLLLLLCLLLHQSGARPELLVALLYLAM